jgi:serine protease AprX
MMGRRLAALVMVAFLTTPLSGSIAASSYVGDSFETNLGESQIVQAGQITSAPPQEEIWWDSGSKWWEVTSLDKDRNRIHDSIQQVEGIVNVGVSFSREIDDSDRQSLLSMGFEIRQELPVVNAILLGGIDAGDAREIAEMEGVAMVERYGSLVFYGDVQTPSVKASNSTEYPLGAWDLGLSGKGINIAMVDTGVDNEHPGLVEKFVAGYDAVCYLHSDPQCILAGGREDDGSFDPDDGNQHGTACMGMASATGVEADGTQSQFYGSAPESGLVDVRIGTDVGAGPFENYLIEQEFYESAMNGLQWIIDHRDDAWPGVEAQSHGIDIISLSWGITSHEEGGSDGSDMHSRILDEAMELGVVVSNAAGNSGEDNDGLSGMSASSLSITVAATDDKNTVNRTDDEIAGYSSRGPRKDNGDGNPLNELIPEISAPGTNIIQAEACVTSGSCNNFLGGDASENTYTGRGSGTSYAAPAVSGIVALLLDANPNLNPLQIKEVLKHTSEVRGDPSAPEVDPYWNREFGFGIVDALAAAELALFLLEANQTESIDPTLQSRGLNLSQTSIINITGHAWGQSGSVDRVEYRIDNGPWFEATYSSHPEEVGALTPFHWHIILDPEKLPEGQNTVEVHAVYGNKHSLPNFFEVYGSGSDIYSQGMPPVVIGIVLLVAFAWVGSLVFVRLRSDEEIEAMLPSFGKVLEEPIDAEILD